MYIYIRKALNTNVNSILIYVNIIKGILKCNTKIADIIHINILTGLSLFDNALRYYIAKLNLSLMLGVVRTNYCTLSLYTLNIGFDVELSAVKLNKCKFRYIW